LINLTKHVLLQNERLTEEKDNLLEKSGKLQNSNVVLEHKLGMIDIV